MINRQHDNNGRDNSNTNSGSNDLQSERSRLLESLRRKQAERQKREMERRAQEQLAPEGSEEAGHSEDDASGAESPKKKTRKVDPDTNDINKKLLDLIKSRKNNKRNNQWVKEEIVSALRNPKGSYIPKTMINSTRSARSRNSYTTPHSSPVSPYYPGAIFCPHVYQKQTNYQHEQILRSNSHTIDAHQFLDSLDDPITKDYINTGSWEDFSSSESQQSSLMDPFDTPQSPDTPLTGDQFPWTIIDKVELERSEARAREEAKTKEESWLNSEIPRYEDDWINYDYAEVINSGNEDTLTDGETMSVHFMRSITRPSIGIGSNNIDLEIMGSETINANQDLEKLGIDTDQLFEEILHTDK